VREHLRLVQFDLGEECGREVSEGELEGEDEIVENAATRARQASTWSWGY
jgi:hypothetical protein